MNIKTVEVKSILSRSRIPGVTYCINPYIGCWHGCRYCYADFMKKYSNHTESWGEFVDIKINAVEILKKQIKKAKKKTVIISSVTDPYNPLESKYQITRECLKILLECQFPISILTKSPLVVRDIDLFTKFNECEVGLTITTDNDQIRKIFEPNSPPIEKRIEALQKLKEHNIKTYIFIGPVLPMNPENLGKKVAPFVDYYLIDKMNYPNKILKILRKYKCEFILSEKYFQNIKNKLESLLKK